MRTGASRNASLGARWERKGAMRGEVFKADLRVSSSSNDSDSGFANTYTLRPPGVPDTRNRQAGATGNRLADFTGDYERPNATGMLKLGYKISENRNSFDTRYAAVDPLTLAETVNPMRTNRFGLEEDNLALYGSYELRASERWGVLGGLRAEHTRLDIDQVTSGIRAANSYTSYIPSFFVNYNVSKDTDVRLSYARRIRRPGANDLNPFVVYRDEFNVASGNPELTPTETDSLELALETKVGKVDTNLRAYYRHEDDLISERRYFISDTVLLTTRDNSGSAQSGGLEFTLGGRLLPKLTIHTSGNLAYMEQRVWNDNLGGDTRRNATSLSGRARFNVQLSKQDSVQVMLNAQGKTLFGQGYRRPASTATINYRRAVTPALSLTVNVNDVFNTTRTESITDTALLKETNVRRFDSRVLYIGLSYRLGGFAPARRPM
jgi:outer membrane receptor protein involved in Fe transport